MTEFDLDDFTPAERIEALEAMVEAAEAEPEEDLEFEYEDEEFENALLYDLKGISRKLGRELTNREAEALITYALETGNAPATTSRNWASGPWT